MKMKVNTKELTDAVSIISKNAFKTMYDLRSNIKLEIDNNILNIYAGNSINEISYSMNIESDNNEPVVILVFAKKLLDVIKNLDKKHNCEIEIVSDKMYISQGDHKSLIIGRLDELEAREININEYVEIDSQIFLKAITDCQKCLAKDAYKPALEGIYFDFENANTVNLVATNCRQMIIKTLEYKGAKQKNIIVNPDTINLIKSSIKKSKVSTEVIKIASDDTYIKILSNGYTITGAGIDGKYPDYNKVIPKEYNNTITVDRKYLLQALKIIKPMISDLRSRMFNIKIIKNEMYLISRNKEMGQSQVCIDCENDADDLLIAFNINYFTDAIKKSTDDKIILKINDENKPSEIAGTIIMPMNAIDDDNIHSVELLEAYSYYEESIQLHAAIIDTINNSLDVPIHAAIESVEIPAAMHTKLANINSIDITNKLTRKQRRKSKYQKLRLVKNNIKSQIENDNVKKADAIRINIIRLYGVDISNRKAA